MDRFKNEYSSWFAGLDETAKNALDQLYAKHPKDTFFALTGEFAPDELPSGNLAEVLNPEGAYASYEFMPYFSVPELEVDPKGPEANAEFTVRWTVTNGGTDSAGRFDLLELLDYDTGDAVYTGDRIGVGAMASGQSEANGVTIPGLPPGNYRARLTVNVDGAYNPNDATREVGPAGSVDMTFGVGGFDPTRPATPEAANLEAVSQAAFYLGSINNTDGEAQAQENLALALQSYAGVLPMGLTEDDDLMPRVLEVANDVRELQIAAPVAFQRAISADADAAAEVMQQVSGLVVTPADGA